MEIVSAGKNFVTIEADQNEVIDTEQFLPDIGQRRLMVSYFVADTGGKLEYSGDPEAIEWIEAGENSRQIFTNDLVYPRYLRPTIAGKTTINFVVK